MKKAIAFRICIVIAVSMIATVLLSCYLQLNSAKEAMYANSVIRIDQIAQILDKNDTDVERLKENLKEDYIIRAKAAAYILQNHSEVVGNLEEARKIASLLQVDELHLFDPEGTLYFGTDPQYYQYNFHSGEQMQFFLPLLNDYSLELCQEVTPNTAEQKLMQYVAVWQEDHKAIIQIGMEPVRLLEAMNKNELPHLFSMLTIDQGSTAFAADPETGIILGATNGLWTGQSMADLGISLPNGDLPAKGITSNILGVKSFSVIENVQHVLVGVSSTYDSLYQNVWAGIVLVILSMCILSVIIVFLILKMLDRYIINGIRDIITALRRIAGGDLDASVEVSNSQEFVELSRNINEMVKSLLEMTGKLSLVFENVNVPMAVYEYNRDMKRVLATSKIGEILRLSEEDLHSLLSSRDTFCEKIKEISTRAFDQEKDVFLVEGETLHYVKIKSYEEKHKTLGILVDVTEEVTEKQQIKRERDIDLLTELYSRRAFFDEMERIFGAPEILKIAMFLMVDLDNLKYVNDGWGHENGDKLLQTAAKILKECDAPHKVVTRLSGDEFVLVIYGADSQEEIRCSLDRLCERLQKAAIPMPDGETIRVSLSGGYVFYPEVQKGYKELLHLADQTMYKVKKSGKCRFDQYRSDPF